ncbi:hypothetical protein [Labedaea rhizosphaerae]|uniref:Uncharacterized protein n=1 Tax=Labedaea rhizosphaerae TaxID=598644 RepID=A0A4R6SHT5_LABRH|nr:hypothetical protein [Labedaea rhizosphaerae]TDQ00936.1 hypothetical protein EV186_102802 [Labedaea rhizosphaerae]
MGWPETHRYYAALREIENTLDRTERLPWHAGYQAIFGDRHTLLLALWRRWEIMVQAQGDDVTAAELAAAHPGLVRVLRAHATELAPLRFTDPVGEFAWGGAA